MWIKFKLVNDNDLDRSVSVNMDNIVNYLPSGANSDFTVLEDVAGHEIEVKVACEKIDEMLMVVIDI